MKERARRWGSALSLIHAYSWHCQEIRTQFDELEEYERRRRIEKSLLTGANEFSVPGYCYITTRYSTGRASSAAILFPTNK